MGVIQKVADDMAHALVEKLTGIKGLAVLNFVMEGENTGKKVLSGKRKDQSNAAFDKAAACADTSSGDELKDRHANYISSIGVPLCIVKMVIAILEALSETEAVQL